MKMTKLLRCFFKGNRFAAFILILLMTWAMLCGIIAYGRLRYIYTDLRTIRQSDLENAGLLVQFPNKRDLMTGSHTTYAEDVEKELEASAEVRDVFSIKSINAFSESSTLIHILIYEPQMIRFFPDLRKRGLSLSDNPSECILTGNIYDGVGAGEQINLRIADKSVSFTVAERIQTPNTYIRLSESSTTPVATDLFLDDGVVIVQKTDWLEQFIQENSVTYNYDMNLIVYFYEGISAQKKQALINQKASEYLYYSLDEVADNTQSVIEKTVKKEMPLPIFLALTSMFAFLSIAVLTVRKNGKFFSILYLCGYSKRKCSAIALTAMQLVSTIPVLLNALFIVIWPRIKWSPAKVLLSSYPAAIKNFVYKWIMVFSTITVSVECIYVLLVYYLTALIAAAGIVLLLLRKQSPLANLRGVADD